jgi:type IV secretory pathway VirB10-like protein
MKVVVYFCVALVAALSVAFGLDWDSAPMSPMPASPYELRAAVPPPPPAVVARVEPRAELKVETKAQAPAPAVAAVQPVAAPPAPVPPPDQQPAAIIADEPNAAAATPPAPRCDLEACASAYRSFTPEDCTYQPNEGPRRLCTRGTPPAAIAAPIVPPTAPEARAQACNIAACSQSYPRSFSSADCTFQPAEGPRRACTK